MRNKLLHLGCVLAIAAALAVWSAPAQAITFGFDDMYYLSSGKAFSSVFPGATGTTSSAGVYQETQDAAHGGIIITKLSTSGVPGEFVQNTSLSNGLYLIGWTQSLNSGQQVDNVFNINSTNPYFQYKTGDTGGFLSTGTTTAFTFNSFQLKGGGTYTFVGEDQNGHQIGTDTRTVTLTSSFQTFTENWQNVYTIYFTVSPGGSAGLYMDSVEINDPVPAVPIPPTALLLGTGLLGLVVLRPRRKKKLVS
jgi:hypothetical protein